MGIFSFLFLMGFVSTSSGNFCSKRFTNGKWISHGDCGEKPDRGSITNDLAKGVSCPVVLPSVGLKIDCSGFKYGDTCNFDCEKGFNMNGVGRSITCDRERTTGRWSGTIPTCLSVACPAVQPTEGLKIDCTGTKYGDKCKFSCEKGYNMNGVGDSITCDQDGATGRWIGSVSTCSSVSCPAVLPSEGLKIDCTGTKYGDECKFSCEKGFNMNGVGDSITCAQEEATGRWNGTQPACISVSCPAVLLSEGLKTDCTGSKYGDKCKFSCEKGFNMNGVGDSITCEQEGATGRWIGAIPSCLSVSCPAVQQSEGLKTDCTGVKYGNKCKFSCEKGFNMKGVGDSITCDQEGATGRWTGIIPTCLKSLTKCESLGGRFSRQKCYTIPYISSSLDMDYDEAVSECAKHGALLAEIHDRDQQNELRVFALSKLSAGRVYVYIWIGMEYQLSTSKLLYRSGKRIPTNQLQWYTGYPTGSYKYLAFAAGRDDYSEGMANQAKSNNFYGVLCEKDI